MYNVKGPKISKTEKEKRRKPGTMVLPVGDEHFIKDEYQKPQQEAALRHCRQFRRAVDAGAHVGYWSKNFAKRFQQVEAFEPDDDNVACLAQNTSYPPVRIHSVALGDHLSSCRIVVDSETNSGAKHVELDKEGVVIIPLDLYNFDDVDLLKIDTQGHEVPILKGAIETIKRSRPVVVVEMPNKSGDPTLVAFFADLGYEVAEKFWADWIFVYNGD